MRERNSKHRGKPAAICSVKFLLPAIATGLFANAGVNLMQPAQAQAHR
jgi:hypothetical protein